MYQNYNSVRTCQVPNFIINEIILARQRYFIAKKNCEDFYDGDFIWFMDNGKPHGRGDYKVPFSHICEIVGIPKTFHFHDIRHSFSTIMLNNQVSLKEISMVMGHSNEVFTLNAYVDTDQFLHAGIPEIYPLIERITEEIETEKILDCHINLDFLIKALHNYL